MRKDKYIKACPFLRDLGDSYLCVNNDAVVDVILDPLLNIEWSEELPPVASEVEGTETCLFVLEIKEDKKLYCTSRKMNLVMDKREIVWDDMRDSVFLLDINSQSEFQDTQIDFCSTCLYKVLIASSPAFQSRLDYNEKIKLGWGYILNKANEIYKSIIRISESYVLDATNRKDDCVDDKKSIIDPNYHSSLNWLTWIFEEDREIDEIFSSTTFEWLQKFDEWGLIVSKIADAETSDERISYVRESFEYAARIKEIAFEIIMKLSFIESNGYNKNQNIETITKIITVASVQFEDFMFICSQFFSIIESDEKS